MNVRREAPIVILLGLLTVSLWLVLMAFNRSYPLGLVLAFLIGVSGGIAMIGVATLTQAICPNYILGRVTGLREVLSNFASVAVNLVIWQLPRLRALNPRVPKADPILIFLLYPLAAVLALVALRGLWRYTSRGPMDSALANILWRLCRLYTTVWHRLRWIGAHRIPRQGPIILASNHTTGLDPSLIQTPMSRPVTWVMLTSYRFRGLEFLWRTIRPITLNPAGGDVAAVREIVHRLRAGEAVGLFPEGGLQRTQRQLQPFAPGIAMIALRGHAAIVPVWIDGTPRHKNMLWHFLCPSRSTVVFGRPYHPDPALSYQEITDDLRRRMLELSQQVGRQTVPGAPS
jgi:1-acyl-sn-glycerol-3-phosphate acyltransferase